MLAIVVETVPVDIGAILSVIKFDLQASLTKWRCWYRRLSSLRAERPHGPAPNPSLRKRRNGEQAGDG